MSVSFRWLIPPYDQISHLPFLLLGSRENHIVNGILKVCWKLRLKGLVGTTVGNHQGRRVIQQEGPQLQHSLGEHKRQQGSHLLWIKIQIHRAPHLG